jgi:hypothetical protein
LYVSHFDAKAFAPQLLLNNKKSKMDFRKQGFGRAQTQREKLAMIRLCEEMQTMLMKEICSKVAHTIIIT